MHLESQSTQQTYNKKYDQNVVSMEQNIDTIGQVNW